MSSLVPLELWVRPTPGPRLPQLRQALAREALVHTVQAVADFLQMVVQIATVQRQ